MHLNAEGRFCSDSGAQHVAGSEVAQAVLCLQLWRLRAFAAAWRPCKAWALCLSTDIKHDCQVGVSGLMLDETLWYNSTV